MSNTLGYFNPLFYANEALMAFEKSLGIASRVHRGYEQERATFNRGEYINIKGPATFAAQDAPSTAQDLATDSIQIQLAYWREVKFKLTDKELAFTTEQIIAQHINPAAYALARDVNEKLAALLDLSGYETAHSSGTPVSSVVALRKGLFDQAVPKSMPLTLLVDSTMAADMLGNASFTGANMAGDQGADEIATGMMGRKFGFDIFESHDVAAHTAGSLSGTPLAVGAHAKGATTLSLDAATLTGTVKRGDLLTFGSYAYAVAADATASGNAITVTIPGPGLRAALADNEAGAMTQTTRTGIGAGFARDAFALAVGPLPEMAKNLGAQVRTVTNPASGLSMRSRLFYDGDNSSVNVALDILYGIKTINPHFFRRYSR